MAAEHFEFLVEDYSTEVFLDAILNRILGHNVTHAIHAFQGKDDLLSNLGARLRAYRKWIPDTFRIVIIVDRDSDDCRFLKQRLEKEAADAGLKTRSICGDPSWTLVNRIAIEELEAWFFGEWTSVCRAFPRVNAKVRNQSPYRNSDAVAGGTWEALERILRRAGYYAGGYRKIEAARVIGVHYEPSISNSSSFIALRNVLLESIGT